ncbi:hypothetical protein JHK84_044365 [Glycine max]|nr:hypothetical protein JHK84_044365 [Glycine max]
MVTAYDYPAVVHLETAGVDICLVGDSAAMVVHGHHTTLPITLEEMLVHCRAGARGAKTPLLVGDLAFGTYESSSNQVMLVRLWCLCLIVSLVGLTSQAISVFGGFRPQGKNVASAVKISESARSVSDLQLRYSSLIQEIWHGSLLIPDLCFSNLHFLTVDECQFLSDAVPPFNLIPLLSKLEMLNVRNCDSVKTIFDVKYITQDRIMTNLENVWNEDPNGILIMQLLQQVCVHKCESLTSVFPASVAKDLVKLEDLVVEDCEGLMAIVAEDNADPTGANLELTFPHH